MRMQAHRSDPARGDSARTAARQRGAALVLVLLVIPALALAGLAVIQFGLLEAGRVNAQQSQEQALLWGEGALCRASWALSSGKQLEQVGSSLPGGVVLLAAEQDGRSSGQVTWNGTPVLLTGVGLVNGARRTVRQQYQTSDWQNIFKNVLVSPGPISIASPNPPAVISTVNGSVLTADPSTDLSSVQGDHPTTIGSVPLMNVDAFITRMLAAWPSTAVNSGQITSSSESSPYLMDAVTGTRLYYTNDPGLHVANSGAAAHVVVRGTVFWLIRSGAYFGKEMLISGWDSNARLVIAVTLDPSNQKGWDLDKLGVIDVPTVLISDGSLYYNKESTLSNISMYGSSITAAKGQDFQYDPDIMDPFIEQLQATGELPAPVGVNSTLTRLSGTWQEVTPTL